MRYLFLLALAGCAATPPAGPALEAETFVLPDSVVAVLEGVAVVEGGLSGLDVAPNGDLWAVADRGPNLEAGALAGRPAKRFALPDYTPPLVRLALEGGPRGAGTLRVLERRPIATPGGAATGRPVPASGDATVETALGPDGETLEPDPWGIDAEGVAFDGRSLWVAEEYRPSLWRLDAVTGAVLERWTPAPADALDRPLPPVIEGRQPNLGFEGVAVLEGAQGRAVWASLQGPITTPTSSPRTPFVRLLRLDPETGAAATFAYPMDGPLRKLGDLAAHGGRLLVVEHGPDGAGAWSGQVYALEVARAAPLRPGDAPEDAGTVGEAEAAGVPVLAKTLVLDLVPAGWPAALHKPEGLAVLPDGRLAVLADNDYGVDAPAADGRPVATGARTTLVVFRVPGL